jgi:hypothetical protein
MAALTVASLADAHEGLGEIVLYHAADQDDAAEIVAFPLCAHVSTFAAIVTRVHPGREVDLMVLDPSKGPMPRWKVRHAAAGRPGHWSYRKR